MMMLVAIMTMRMKMTVRIMTTKKDLAHNLVTAVEGALAAAAAAAGDHVVFDLS